MRTLRALAAAGVVAAGIGLALAAPSQAAGTSQVSILRGVPGLNVDASRSSLTSPPTGSPCSRRT